MDLHSTVRFTSDGTVKEVDLTYKVYEDDNVRVYFDGEEILGGWALELETTPQKVIFDEVIPDGVNGLIRRATDMREIPHVFHFTGNVKGGAEFNARNMDENFDKMRRGIEDAMDSFELVGINVEAAVDANLAADRAEAAAEDAEQSYQNTLAYDQQGEMWKNQAKGYAEDAQGYLVVVESDANRAEAAANAAEASELAAKSARDVAVGAASDAETSENNAAGSASAAQSYAQSAQSQANAALNHSEAAETYKQDAASSASAASQSASNAAGSAGAAQAARNVAEAHRDKAKEWASNPEDVVVQDGQYSAYHWAQKAQEFVGGPYLRVSNNLSEVDPEEARNNLGVTDLFVQLAGAEALTKADRMSPCFTKVGAQALSVKAGTSVLVDDALIHFKSDTPVTLPSLTAGEDYAVFVNPDGTIEAVADPFSSPASPPQSGSRKIGGFHYGLTPPDATVSSGSFATSGPGMHWTQADVNRIRGINEFSIWDVRFRSAGEQHGFAFDPQARVWVAIYFCGPDHITDGISRYNSAVASDTVPAKIPLIYGGNGSAVYTDYSGEDSDVKAGCWWNFMEVAHSHGARMLWEREFNSAAFGTTEQQAIGGSSVTIPATKREPGYTSRIGLEQVSGHHYTWGMDSNYREGSEGARWYDHNGGRGKVYTRNELGIVRVRLGGSRTSAPDSCGSRAATWSDYPWDGNWDGGLRAACDLLIL